MQPNWFTILQKVEGIENFKVETCCMGCMECMDITFWNVATIVTELLKVEVN